jgi:hypothetical protein
MSRMRAKAVKRKKSSDAESASAWDWSKTARFEIRFPVEFLKAVDLWRGQQADVPNRSEAVRRLAEIGLASGKIKGKTKVK